MNLIFEVKSAGKLLYITVSERFDLLDDGLDNLISCLDESYYQQMHLWCIETFNQNAVRPTRAYRVSYDTFCFSSEVDMDWFVLYWSGIDNR